jgi:UDP-N-acetylmuramoyl-tripeptide--D-alanyl-D-alanine ligase
MKINLSGQEIETAVKGVRLSGDSNVYIQGISTDSRNIHPGDFFIPIQGETHDGHQYLAKAMQQGAIGAFIQKERVSEFQGQFVDKLLIAVDDSKYAMGELAKYYLRKFQVTVIGITGSNGKTSTKEMIAAILSRSFNVLKNEGSFNNDIGLPLTIFTLEPEHQVLIQEIGMNHEGEIRRLVDICPPDIGVVTNVAEAHIEYFGSLDKIADAKFELLEKMDSINVVILNRDDPRVALMQTKTKARPVWFGIQSQDAEFSASDIRFVADPLGVEFQLKTPGGNDMIHLPVLGEHQVANAVAAVATAWQLVPNLDVIKQGLESFKSAKMRMQIIPCGPCTILNDAYNANLNSMTCALETLKKLPVNGKKIAVLGVMRELGDQTEAAHLATGRLAASSGIQQLIVVGAAAQLIAQGAEEAGFNSQQITRVDSNEEAAQALIQVIQPGDLVFFKASRKLYFEQIVEQLKKYYLPIEKKL